MTFPLFLSSRKAVAPQDESPDPDDSSQEYMLSDDMKTTW